MKPSILMALLALAGCATTGGGGSKTATRYTGYPYDITDEGSRISGLVCGMSIDYSVSQHGDVTRVSGFGQGPMFFEVRDKPGARHLTGSLGGSPSRAEVELVLTSDLLRGQVGLRSVELSAAADDTFQGRYQVRGTIGSAAMKIEGRDLLWKLPPAELAALLPGMLNCEGPIGRPVVQGPVAVRFGGPPGYETPQANQIFR